MTPKPHQLKPIAVLTKALRCNRSALDASDTGVGKTFHALFAAKADGRPVAVVCPKSAKPAWEKAVAAVGVGRTFIENIEQLKAKQYWIKGEGTRWKWAATGGITIVDEVHRFSGYDTENGFILATAPKPVLMLSATCANSPIQMRGIAHQLGLCKWSEWYQWCARNGCKRAYFGGIEFNGDTEILDRIHRSIFTTGLGVRVRISEIPDFPANFIETVSVPVANQKAINEAYAEELRALESNAPSQAVAILRARQVSEHCKLASTIELIEDTVESGRSVVMFVNFRESLVALMRHFKCLGVYGDQNPHDRQAAIDAFTADKDRVLICMIQAGGESINLPDLHGRYPRSQFIFPGWSARELIQAWGRCPRTTSVSPVITKLIFAADTEEERVQESVNRKLTQHAVLNDGDLTMPRTNNPETTTSAPESTTTAPIITTMAPIITTVAPIITTVAPETLMTAAVATIAHADREHAKISPSKLKNLELSPMWIPDPEAEEHWKTTRGTRCHEALESGKDDALQDDSEREWVAKCREYLAQFPDWVKHAEQKLEMSNGIWGFADLILIRGAEARLIDFKFSESLQEDTETNPAAQAYVLGIWNKWPEVQAVEVDYLYPILDQISTFAFERCADEERLALHLATIAARVKAAKECSPYYETCLWCGRKATCAQLHKMALPLATRYQEKHAELAVPSQWDPAQITDPAAMSKAMAAAQILEKWSESVRFHALKLRQESGQEIPQYDLRTRSGKKRILDPVGCWSVVEKMGVTKEEFLQACEVSLKSLTETASKRAPKGGKAKLTQQLEDELRNSGILEIAPDVVFLQRSKEQKT